MNVSYEGLTGTATLAHIHGPATTTGTAPPMVTLNSYAVGGFGSSGSLSGTAILTPDQLAALVDGLTYINIHTAANGSGEIRGQILPRVTGVPLTTILSGAAEQPANASTGTGNATFSLDGDALTFNIVYTGLSGQASAAHIHGPAGTAQIAPPIIDLAPYNGGSYGASGRVSGSVRLTPDQRLAVLNGQTYVNFHTAAFGDGEIRGQIAPVLLTAGLSGKNERPSPVATTGSGSATFALVRDQLTVNATYRNLLSAANGSHIHGPAGFTGSPAPILVDLGSLNGGSFGTSGALFGTTSSIPIPALLAIIDQRSYINVHTPSYTGGEIRGHLMK